MGTDAGGERSGNEDRAGGDAVAADTAGERGATADGPPFENCRPEARSYTCAQELVDNLPYIVMLLLGSAALVAALGQSPQGFLAAGLYFAYGVVGAFWIMLFVCPFCHFHGTRSCPCGYGRIAAGLRAKKDEALFRRQFRRHIPVIVPLWLIPPAVAGTILWRGHAELFGAPGGPAARAWLIAALVAAFVFDSVVVLPLVSRKYGCAHCPQKADCPWMGGGGDGAS